VWRILIFILILILVAIAGASSAAAADAALVPVAYLPVVISDRTPSPEPGNTGDVRITTIFYIGTGGAEPDEYVQIKNFDDKTIQLEDWTLRDLADHVFTFPSFLMEPGMVCQVYTNRWNASACNFSYQSRQPIWSNIGDCAFLRDSAGAEVSTYCY
jgi:hypothetical protein